jgi:hypothetical protein
MTEIRISFVVWEDYPDPIKQVRDYSSQWKNFTASIWTDDKREPSSREILQTDYNARIENNDIIFATSEDAVRFILRWS